MIRNILFDMGNVLIRFDPPAFLDRLGITDLADRKALLEELFGSTDWVALDRGALTEEEVIARVCARVEPRLAGTVRALVTGWDKPCMPVEGMEELCEELRERGYGLYLLTNAGPRHRQYWFDVPVSRLFPEERIMRSADWLLLKPEAAFYEKALSLLGLRREECLFIDDSALNAEAAGRCGIRNLVFRGSAARLRREMAALGVDVKTNQ